MTTPSELLQLARLARELVAKATATGQVKLGTPDRLRLQDSIYHELVKKYEREARSFHADLGGDGKFKLDAAWKKDELAKRAKAMARSLTKTTRERLAELKANPPEGGYAAAKKEFLRYKAEQLQGVIDAEAQFQAQTDLLVHSGVVEVNGAKIMYFQPTGGNTCNRCLAIAGSSPYTIEEASAIGSEVHPNGECSWRQNVGTGAKLLGATQEKVRARTVTLWSGTAKTPAPGRARAKQKRMQTGDWQQRATAAERIAMEGQRS